MRASRKTCLAVGFVIGSYLFVATAPAEAHIRAGATCTVPSPPRCDNGIDDDSDSTTDFDGGPEHGTPDSDCTLPSDPEGPGKFGCKDLGFLIAVGQVIVEFDRGCPECNGIEIIDIGDLSDLILTTPKDWKVLTPVSLERPVEGVIDDPKIANLRLQYTGSAKVAGPAELGTIRFREPIALSPGLRYVGRAFDAQTGRNVTNVGTLELKVEASPTSKRGPNPVWVALGLFALAGLVGWIVWRVRSH